VIEATGLTHRYGSLTALTDLDLSVPEGSVYALIGPNGAGKTTLLQILRGLRHPSLGEVLVFGKPVGELTAADRAAIGYVAEGMRLPGWMTVGQLEAYVGPLYPAWDNTLADELRARFRLDPARRIGALSKGERMKAALLCALAPRPRLLLMDEPFSGMDALVKDELVRGVLESAGVEGWTVLVCSHDLGELEMLADHLGFLDRGRLLFSEPMDVVRETFCRVEVVTGGTGETAGTDAAGTSTGWPAGWLSVERSGQRMSILVRDDATTIESSIRSVIPGVTRVEIRPATLREIFVALAPRQAGVIRTWETA